MVYQIDQSGKVEDTARNTVLALCNGSKRTVLITAQTKRELQERFRIAEMPRRFVYLSFVAGLFYLLEHLKQVKTIIIDTEYPGHEESIGKMLANLLAEYDKPKHTIRFARIGNRPKVHYLAKDVFDKKKKADRILGIKGMLKVIKKTDGRLRECF
ncbi:MAG: hypothetical protein WBO77_01350 [Microgenomates group bacterium]